MAENILLVKAQFDLPADDTTVVYTCPEGRTNTVTLFLCNRSTLTAFHILLAIGGEAFNAKQYIYYATPLPTLNTLKLTITLNQGDVLSVYVDTGAVVSCNVFVDESKPLRK